MPWFNYSQNNTWGRYNGPRDVYVEAEDAPHANKRAQEVAGVYFSGVRDGHDCPCCGDRWHRVHPDNATDYPENYIGPLTVREIIDAYNAGTLFPLED